MGLWSWIKNLFGKKEKESPPISLVMFLKEPRFLTKEILINEIKKSFAVDLGTEDSDSKDFVVGGDDLPTFIIQFQGRTLAVHNIPVPYVDDVEKAAEQFKERRLWKVV